jgi:diguanylate cyclase (GGDEF)-like protein
VITISVGVAAWRRGITQCSDLVHLADEALYEAKRLGRNRVVLIDEEGTLRPM